jgi:hypothetical protein
VLDEETENIAALSTPKTVKYLLLLADCKRGILAVFRTWEMISSGIKPAKM